MQAAPSSMSDPAAYFEHEASLDWNRQASAIQAQQRAARQYVQQAQLHMDESSVAGAFDGASATPAAATSSSGGRFGAHAASPHPASLSAMCTPQPSPFPAYAGAVAAGASAASAASSGFMSGPAPAAAAGAKNWESLLDPEEQQDLVTRRAREQRAVRRQVAGARYSMF